MKIIGLTGGIGSGKSTIAKMFEKLGIPVYYSDNEAKKLMVNSSVIQNKIKFEFGENSYTNNHLNTDYLAQIVFNNKASLDKLNAIVHPEVRKHFQDWVTFQNAPYLIQENPLIFESKSQNDFDAIIFVSAPKQLRLLRTVKRDNSTIEKVEARMKNQMEDESKTEKSNFVIKNIDLDQSKGQVSEIHKEILKLNI